MTNLDRDWKTVTEVSDFPEGFDIEAAVTSTLEWWPDRKTVAETADFIDRFCKDHGGSGWTPGDWDMESYDSPAAKEVMKAARRVKREQES